jgi:hypothetical protein
MNIKVNNEYVDLRKNVEIKIVGNGMWGGVIPDELRSGCVKIVTKNVTIQLDKEEFTELRKVLTENVQEMYDISEKRIKVMENNDKVIAGITNVLEELRDVAFEANGELYKKLYDIWNRLDDAYINYWSRP